MVYELFFAGVLGGCVRALYGLLKSVSAGKRVRPWYFVATLLSSGIIGGVLGLVFDVDVRFASLAGYVGSDVLENVASAVLPKSLEVKK